MAPDVLGQLMGALVMPCRPRPNGNQLAGFAQTWLYLQAAGALGAWKRYTEPVFGT